MVAHTFLYYWVGWIIIFAGIEGAALYVAYKHRDQSDNGGTLSELVWRILGTKSGKRHIFWFAVFTVFWVWLTLHFFLGW